MRRELWESLSDVLTAFAPTGAAADRVRIRSVDLHLPMEVVMPKTAVGFRLLADVPRQRWAHGFAERPTRIRVSFHPIPAPPGPSDLQASADDD